MIRKDKLLKDLEPILMDGCSSPVAEYIYRTVCEQPEKFDHAEIFDRLCTSCRYGCRTLKPDGNVGWICEHHKNIVKGWTHGICNLGRCPLLRAGEV